MMKRLLLGVTALASLLVGPAVGADLRAPVYKAPPAPPPPVYSWTGCYIGGNIGWAQSNSHFTIDGFDDGSHRSDGFAGGGQIGCDYQFYSNWLVGVRGLFDGADFHGSNVSPFDDTLTFRSKTRWFGTVTGRLGFLVTPTFLIYGQGGWGFVNQRLSVLDTATGATAFTAGSSNFNGADAGAGVEWMFTPNWTLWVEWDHIFRRDKTVTFNSVDLAVTDTFQEGVRRDFDKVLVGINWRFGGVTAPVRAAY